MNPYVPVLRWKGAEINAVADLPHDLRKLMKPVFEIIPKDFEKITVEREAALRVRDISYNWGWDLPCFVDFSLLQTSQIPAAFAVLERSEYVASTVTTVIGGVLDGFVLGNSSLVKKYGFCIRINAFDFRQTNFQRSVLELVQHARIAPENVDIIIDYRVVETEPSNMRQLVEAMSNMAHWRNITLLAGAFPPDLSKLAKNNQYLLPRYEWLAFRRYSLEGGIAGFGDYTIQHGIFEEHEKKGLNFSASIRYTGPADWVIMRGESVRNADGPGYHQWPANAQLLCERPEFMGSSFSIGDRYMEEMSQQSDKTGGPKEWLTAGISHHLSYVIHQLENINTAPTSSAANNEAAPDWPARIGN